MTGELSQLLREQRVALAAVRASAKALKASARRIDISKTPRVTSLLLLQMAEGLIAAHRAAKIDDDGYTLDLIEDALQHVGRRLSKETGNEQDFRRKRPPST